MAGLQGAAAPQPPLGRLPSVSRPPEPLFNRFQWTGRPYRQGAGRGERRGLEAPPRRALQPVCRRSAPSPGSFAMAASVAPRFAKAAACPRMFVACRYLPASFRMVGLVGDKGTPLGPGTRPGKRPGARGPWLASGQAGAKTCVKCRFYKHGISNGCLRKEQGVPFPARGSRGGRGFRNVPVAFVFVKKGMISEY